MKDERFIINQEITESIINLVEFNNSNSNNNQVLDS